MPYIRAFIWGGILAALLAAPFAPAPRVYLAVAIGGVVLLIVLSWAQRSWAKRARSVIDPGIYSVTKPPASVVTLNGEATSTTAAVSAPAGAPGSAQPAFGQNPRKRPAPPGMTTASQPSFTTSPGVTSMMGVKRQQKPNGLMRLVCFLLGMLAVWWPQHQVLGDQVSQFVDDPAGYSQSRWGIDISAPADGYDPPAPVV